MLQRRWLTCFALGASLSLLAVDDASAQDGAAPTGPDAPAPEEPAPEPEPTAAPEGAPTDEATPEAAPEGEPAVEGAEDALAGEGIEGAPANGAEPAPSTLGPSTSLPPVTLSVSQHPTEAAPGPRGAAVPADQANAAATSGDERKPGPWGVMLDLGVPDGVMVSGLYKPIEWARVNAGLGYNGVSLGMRIGGALVPFGTGPFFGVDFGHYFGGDANKLARTFAGPEYEDAAVLEDIGYDYMNLRLGLELGGDRFAFIMRGGFTFLRMAIHNLDETIQDATQDSGSTTRISLREDPVVTGVAPTFDLGFAVYF